MKLVMIGFGQAGGKIIDKYLECEDENEFQLVPTRIDDDIIKDQESDSGIYNIDNNSTNSDQNKIVPAAVCFNTARADLTGLNHIPEDQRILIGQSRVKGHGVGADQELGADIVQEEIKEIQEAIEHLPVEDVDAYVIAAGLGGGTGGGGAPVLANHLKQIKNKPTYGIVALPRSGEGEKYDKNASRSLQRFKENADNLMIIDNEVWIQRSYGSYEKINTQIARNLGGIFVVGEGNINEELSSLSITPQEMTSILSSGSTSSIAFASEKITDSSDGLISGIIGGRNKDNADPTEVANRIRDLVEEAILDHLSINFNFESATQMTIVLTGPPEHLNQEGIEQAREWLNNEIDNININAGMDPIAGSNSVSCAVLFPDIDAPRIGEFIAPASDDVNAQDQTSGAKEDGDKISDGKKDTDEKSAVNENDKDSGFGPDITFEDDN